MKLFLRGVYRMFMRLKSVSRDVSKCLSYSYLVQTCNVNFCFCFIQNTIIHHALTHSIQQQACNSVKCDITFFVLLLLYYYLFNYSLIRKSFSLITSSHNIIHNFLRKPTCISLSIFMENTNKSLGTHTLRKIKPPYMLTFVFI